MRRRALVLACLAVVAVTVLVGPVAAQDFNMEPSTPKDYDEENEPPVVYEDRRFDFNIEHDRDIKMFQTEIWYPHDYVNLTVVPASTAWDLDVKRQDRDSQTSLVVKGELEDDHEGDGFSGSTLYNLHVDVKKELRYADLRILPFRIETADGVPTDFTTDDETEQKLEVYPHPKPESNIEITDVEVSPREVSMGDKVSAVFEAENTGDARGSHTAEMLVDGESVGEDKSFNLEEGETYSWEFWYTFEAGEYEPGEYEVSIGGETVTVEVASSGLEGIEVVGEQNGSISLADAGEASAGSDEAQVASDGSGNSSGGSGTQADGGEHDQQMPGFTAFAALVALSLAAAYRLR